MQNGLEMTAPPASRARDASTIVSPRLLSAQQAARYLGVSHWTVRSLTWAGELPSVRLGKRQLRWDVRDLDRFIEDRKHREQD